MTEARGAGEVTEAGGAGEVTEAREAEGDGC